MPKKKKTTVKTAKKPIVSYKHLDKERLNNPPVGIVTPETDPDAGKKKKYEYDPHLDPQLVWAGKAERTSFEIPTVSLHVHERIDARTILEAVKKKNGNGWQGGLFDSPDENLPLRDAIHFYKHKMGWTNRLIAGDSLLVMNSLIEKEGMAGQVQMIYFDPPYGIKYGSNFQPFVNKRDVKDGKDEDLTQEPEMIKAFRDTWELGIHSYLAYLRDRLLLARDLLHESGSIFVQISNENIHHVKELMDEIFGNKNFANIIAFKKSGSQTTSLMPSVCDYIVWYIKNMDKSKFKGLFIKKKIGIDETEFNQIINNKSEYRTLTNQERLSCEIPEGYRIFKSTDLNSRSGSETTSLPFEFKDNKYKPRKGAGWRTNIEGLKVLASKNRLFITNNTLRYIHYFDDFPYSMLTNIWDDIMGATNLIYAVQTNPIAIQRCMLMTTDPGDLVLDFTCGSGTTAYVAEQWGRRWITCDTSRVATALTKQRLMTALFDYYELAHPPEGVGSGFKYKTVPHITLKSIANNEPPPQETLYDQPYKDKNKVRVTGPFTVEAVPAPIVKSIDDIALEIGTATADDIAITTATAADVSISRSGETLRQNEWKDELLRTGIRAKAGKHIRFTRIETLPTRWLHAEGEADGERVVVSFGPEYAPLEQRQVELAIEEAQTLVPKPKLIVFAAFQFDPEASKDIDELNWPGVTLIKAQMNADLLTEDLKKKRSSNESFWLIGQPDVRVEKICKGEDAGKYKIEVHGFDYYNPVNGLIESGGTEKIAMWMLDTDYDGRSLYPQQVFFPMSGAKDGWSRLAKNLKAEIDEDLIEQYRGTVSLLFSSGEFKRAAVKIIDDRGIESLKIVELE
ncbi:MAG: site-specific DNA-methyltransferase [Ignavibacteriae bacterium]|nr:MAG: site-specific DNA-methyltransferase [Ignavibacteriota bacterium]